MNTSSGVEEAELPYIARRRLTVWSGLPCLHPVGLGRSPAVGQIGRRQHRERRLSRAAVGDRLPVDHLDRMVARQIGEQEGDDQQREQDDQPATGPCRRSCSVFFDTRHAPILTDRTNYPVDAPESPMGAARRQTRRQTSRLRATAARSVRTPHGGPWRSSAAAQSDDRVRPGRRERRRDGRDPRPTTSGDPSRAASGWLHGSVSAAAPGCSAG